MRACSFFGIAGLSLLGREGLEVSDTPILGGLKGSCVPDTWAQIVDPVYALPQSTLERLGLSVWGVDAVAE